jgi:hypothetical protein
MKIHRRCECGCGKITKPGNKYINGHHLFGNTNTLGYKQSEDHKNKISESLMGNSNSKGSKRSEGTKLKQSIFMMGNIYAKGCKHSDEVRLKNSISHIKYDSNYEYCDIWKRREYKRDLRKDYCENINCRNNCKLLVNHHIDLDKKNCHPSNIMTLCVSCYTALHNKLRDGGIMAVNPKDFLIINRVDHISYVNKRTRKGIIIRRIDNEINKTKS